MNKKTPSAIIVVAMILGIGGITAIDGSRPGGRSSQCVMESERHKMIIRRGAAPDQLTSTLGVLRRPSTERDRPPEEAFAHVGLAVVWVDDTRLLTSAHSSWRLFVVPGVIASGCGAHGAPESLAIGLVTYEGRSLVGTSTYTVSDIIEGRAIQVRPAGRNANFISGIVTDDVMTIGVAAGQAPATTVDVKDNYFVAKAMLNNREHSTRYEVKLELLDERGDIVKSITKVIQVGRFSGSLTG
jgi:hypothetical protein